jgi:general stress protein 26
MNSINRNQPEQNREDVRGTEAVEKIRELVKRAKNCFFCTIAGAGSAGARPMNVRQVDDAGNLWFLCANDSHLYQEVAANSSATLYFQGSPHSDFLQLRGPVTVSRDRAKIEELWEPIIKTWFTEGQDDPRIAVLQFTPEEGYYWDTKHGNTVAGIKMMLGAMLGKSLDDSIEGEVRV